MWCFKLLFISQSSCSFISKWCAGLLYSFSNTMQRMVSWTCDESGNEIWGTNTKNAGRYPPPPNVKRFLQVWFAQFLIISQIKWLCINRKVWMQQMHSRPSTAIFKDTLWWLFQQLPHGSLQNWKSHFNSYLDLIWWLSWSSSCKKSDVAKGITNNLNIYLTATVMVTVMGGGMLDIPFLGGHFRRAGNPLMAPRQQLITLLELVSWSYICEEWIFTGVLGAFNFKWSKEIAARIKQCLWAYIELTLQE